MSTQKEAPPKAEQQERLLALWKTMTLVRQAELALVRLFADSEVPGFIHLSVGQEGISTGVASGLKPQDTLATNYRGHGHVLARGMDLDGFFKEIMGRAGGLCQGRGGSIRSFTCSQSPSGRWKAICTSCPCGEPNSATSRQRPCGSNRIASGSSVASITTRSKSRARPQC